MTDKLTTVWFKPPFPLFQCVNPRKMNETNTSVFQKDILFKVLYGELLTGFNHNSCSLECMRYTGNKLMQNLIISAWNRPHIVKCGYCTLTTFIVNLGSYLIHFSNLDLWWFVVLNTSLLFCFEALLKGIRNNCMPDKL